MKIMQEIDYKKIVHGGTPIKLPYLEPRYSSTLHTSVLYVHERLPTVWISPYWMPIQADREHLTNKILRFDLGKEILAWL